MATSHPQAGLDDRHRDADGEISRKHGASPKAGRGSDIKLSTLLKQNAAPSLSQYLKRPR